MPDHENITGLTREVLHSGWATTALYSFEYRRRDGRVQSLRHEVFDHGHGAAVLLHNPAAGCVALVRQFRLSPMLGGDEPMLLEACAGLLDGDTPEVSAHREAREETGIAVTALTPTFAIYSSPGSLTEKVFCFIGTYDAKAPRGPTAQDEGEDIEVVEMTLADALAAIRSGTIIDAKTVALLLHLALVVDSRSDVP